ncbi:glutamate synthase-related protein [Allohahella marinimesophila]|uniref:glutamate synthase-related protein n=1 Tax=Allohahella marinimesophila TaxID=1054972 RepID=UPI003CD0A800
MSGGKSVGLTLCIDSTDEFIDICGQMRATGLKPNFITVDAAEGGTGAAPIDFSKYVGMPWEKTLIFVVNTLRGYDLKKDVRVLTASEIFTAFDIFNALCIGADICSTARGMMRALGCIQSLQCHENTCPTGVTTKDPRLRRGLVVEEKRKRVTIISRKPSRSFSSSSQQRVVQSWSSSIEPSFTSVSTMKIAVTRTCTPK